MGYLTMCALSARARRCGSCVLPSPCPRGDLSTWCVERGQSLPRRFRASPGRDRATVWWASSAWSCNRPSPSRPTRQAAGAPTRPHGYHGFGTAGARRPGLTPAALPPAA